MKIILIGFMGGGKTAIARLVAKKLGLEKVEMDELIVKKSGRNSDREIFAKDGESIFRQLETQVAQELQNSDNTVISTGGGIIMNNINMECLKKNGVVIYLQHSFETAEKRLDKENPPPLFRDKQKAKELYFKRLPLYKKYADIIIETDTKTLQEVTNEIVEKVKTI
jgi:shikimate kinase